MSIMTLSLRDIGPLYKIMLTMKCLLRAAEVLQCASSVATLHRRTQQVYCAKVHKIEF